jgi:ribosomal subunit interface protein
MDVVVVGRHTKVSDEFRSRVSDKLRRIETIDHHASRIDVHVTHERSPKVVGERERVELTVIGAGPIVRAEAAAEDRNVALDLATDRLVERLRKQHERRVDRRHGKGGGDGTLDGMQQWEDRATESVEAWEGAPDTATREIPLDGTPIVIRSKVHTAPPMTVPEAIDQMELVGHDFFLFHDAESGLASVVYRRRGWTYGVIQLERAAVSAQPDSQPSLMKKSA